MKINLSIILIFLLTIVFSVKIAAQNIEFEELKFPGRAKELKKARKEIASGDKLLVGKVRNVKGIGRYEIAIKHYIVANNFNPNNSLLNYKIGFCYLKTAEKYKAVPYLEKAYRINKNVKNDIAYLLGQAYQINYDFDKAIQKYFEFLRSLNAFNNQSFGSRVDKKIQECRNGKELLKNPVNVKISNLGGNVNTQYPEYSPIVNADQTILFFTTRRPNTTGHRVDVLDGKYYEDILISYFKDGVWSMPRYPGRPLNSRRHDALVGISQNGKTLLTYKSTPRDNGDIYVSKLKNDKYTRPRRLNMFINTTFHESSATLSPDGNILYFVSDREGGFGGRDIWMSRKNNNGDWGKVTNLGNVINTSYNEEGVFMQADGKTLYFSSQGHNSMGGYDIFKTVFDNGKWSVPRNIGYPINTPDDDVFLSITKEGRKGYYSSAKKDGFGDLDIYEITFFESKIQETVLISGKVLDAVTKQPVESDIEIKDKDADLIVSNISSAPDDGNYFVSLPNNKTYNLNVTAPEYITYQETILRGKPLNKTIYLYKKNAIVSKGYVFDSENNKPICEAKVSIRNFENKTIADTLISDCKTGEYHSDVLKGKSYDINVSAPGYMPYNETIPEDKDVNKTYYLDKIKPISKNGFVYDSESRIPVCGAKVTVRNSYSKSIVDSIVSDCKTGEYFSEVPKDKSYDILVTANGYIPYIETVSQNEGVNKIYFIDRIKPIDRNGFVFDSESKMPVCGAKITIRNYNTKSTVDSLVSDCKTGEYHSDIPQDKPYDISIVSPGYIIFNEDIKQGQNVNKIYFIDKIKPIVINGYIFDSESKNPVCGAKITLRNFNSKSVVDSLVSDCKTGEYHSDVPQGKSYDILITSPGYIPFNETIQQDDGVNKIYFIDKLNTVVKNGYVFDIETNKPVCGAKVTIKNFNTKSIEDTLASDCNTGEYHSNVPKGKSYDIIISAPGYIPFNETISKNKDVNKTYYIEKIKTAIEKGKLFDVTTAKAFVLPDILYDFNKYDLKPQYRDSLNELITTMKAFPNIVIELGSHTDTRGSEVYNEKLSYNRAKSVVDYLILKNIEPERMVAKGYGKKVSRVLDKTRFVSGCGKKFTFNKGTIITDEFINSLAGGKCETEAAHQLNRRTEFKVIREDYSPNKVKSNKPVEIDIMK